MLVWRDVGTLADIPPRGSIRVGTPAGPVAVFRTGADDVFALVDRCPHKGGPLSHGIVHDARVTCPLHNWVIELATGEAVAPDHGCAQVVVVRLEGARVLLAVTE
ncbi:MAG TPA: nitrite reductase small subunit NirD [Acetobacteraceae bacterium]|nr:nitrite reductase small subunit NirD [Acetobacteraceae bacterium]